MEEIENQYQKIADRAYLEFTDVADYIWKSPRLIEHETKIETRKLKDYFPNNEEHAKLRWHFESNKLNSVFPYLIAGCWTSLGTGAEWRVYVWLRSTIKRRKCASGKDKALNEISS